MCLILFSYKQHPKYPLIVAANRDEFYNRATAPASFWEDEPTILAGRDLVKKGTWMGVAKSGRFAALTNYRDPKESLVGKQSRGKLVANFLSGATEADEYIQEVSEQRSSYPGFNLLVGNQHDLYYYSNITDQREKLQPGLYGVSNHLLNTEWPKVNKGKERLNTILQSDRIEIDSLFEMLQDADPAPDHLLPNTGISYEWEKLLSSMYISSDQYGTRSSAVIVMSEEEVFFYERNYSTDGVKNKEFRFYLS